MAKEASSQTNGNELETDDQVKADGFLQSEIQKICEESNLESIGLNVLSTAEGVPEEFLKVSESKRSDDFDEQPDSSSVHQPDTSTKDFDSFDERLAELSEKQPSAQHQQHQTFPSNRKMKFRYGRTVTISPTSPPSSSTEDTITNDENPNAKPKYRIYITSCPSEEKPSAARFPKIAALEAELRPVARGRVELKETACGLLAVIYDEEDFAKVMRMPLAKVFDAPIVVWNIPNVGARAANAIVVRDVPWCVKSKEIEDILRTYGVAPMHCTRNEDGSVRVVVKNPYSLTKILREGLNFYNCAILPVSLEPNPNPDIIQCYRCQRFWHTAQFCPFGERCVRCGETHDFRTCKRDRKDPNCCLCGDSHHAAYKYCPVRIQHLNAIQVEINMERE